MARTENRIVVCHVNAATRMYYVSKDLACVFDHERDDLDHEVKVKEALKKFQDPEQLDPNNQTDIVDTLMSVLRHNETSHCVLEQLKHIDEDTQGILNLGHTRDVVTVEIHLAKQRWLDIELMIVRTIVESFGWNPSDYSIETATV